MNDIEGNDSLRDRLQQLACEEGIDPDAAFLQLYRRYAKLEAQANILLQIQQKITHELEETEETEAFAIDLVLSGGSKPTI